MEGDGARDGSPAVSFAGFKIPLPAAVLDARPGVPAYLAREVIPGVRPSDFEDAGLADPGWARITVRPDATEELGSEIHVIFTLDSAPVRHPSISDTVADQESADEAAAVLAGGKSLWTAPVAARSRVRSGQTVELAINTANLQFFDPETALAIGRTDAPAAEAPAALS